MSKKPTLTLQGRYKIETFGPDGELRTSLDWFENLITNAGLDLFSGDAVTGYSGSYLYHAPTKYCYVGTSATAPAVTDTQLGALVGTSPAGSQGASINNVADRRMEVTTTYTFDVGAATGNLSEIGVGPIATKLFSRALIKDGAGSPTTITVLADESLRVTYEVRINIPTTTFVSVVDGYTFNIKAVNADGNGSPIPTTNLASTRDWWFSYAGAVGATIDDQPAGSAIASIMPVVDTYVLSSYTITAVVAAGLGDTNGNIASMKWRLGPIPWQASVSPVIAKDDTKLLNLTFGISWAREGEL